MTPTELRQLLLSSDSVQDRYARVPQDARGLLISSSLIGQASKKAKTGSRFRQTIILIGSLSFFIFGNRHDLSVLALILTIAGYEFAYGNVARVRAALIDAQAEEHYRNGVDTYLSTRFPNYRPPQDGATIFSVSAR